MNKCKRHKWALCTATILEVSPDSEPFKSGEFVELEPIAVDIDLTLQVCVKCNLARHITIESQS